MPRTSLNLPGYSLLCSHFPRGRVLEECLKWNRIPLLFSEIQKKFSYLLNVSGLGHRAVSQPGVLGPQIHSLEAQPTTQSRRLS